MKPYAALKIQSGKFLSFLVLSLFLLILVWGCGSESSVTISGTVVNETTNQPVSEATITIGEKSATSSTTGSYQITDISPGTYTLKVIAPKYKDYTEKLEVKGDSKTVDILLSPASVPTSPVSSEEKQPLTQEVKGAKEIPKPVREVLLHGHLKMGLYGPGWFKRKSFSDPIALAIPRDDTEYLKELKQQQRKVEERCSKGHMGLLPAITSQRWGNPINWSSIGWTGLYSEKFQIS